MEQDTPPEKEEEKSEQPTAPETDADGKVIEPDAQKKEINR
jgi:hypothetical protein